MTFSRHIAVLLGCALAVGASVRGAETIVSAPGRVDDIEARLTLARILSYRPETWSEAALHYERVLRDAPSHAQALAELADIRVRQGDLGAAEQRLRAALAARAEDPAAVVPLAKLYLWTSRVTEAGALLDAVRRTRALTDSEAMVAAQVLSRLGRHAEANREFDRLLALASAPSGELLSAAADARLASGDVPGARDLYGRALAVDESLPGAQRGYALTLAWTGDAAAARPRLEQVLRANANDGEAIHAYLGTVYRLLGESTALARARERAEAEPRNATWRAEWADFEARRGHSLRAQALFAEALALADTPELRLQAGRAAVTWGDFNGAEAALRAAIARDPKDLQLRDELGRLFLSADRFEEAEQHYERWLLEQPTALPALLGLVRLRLKEKDFAAAVTRADAVLSLRSDEPEALRLKAEAILAQHRSVDAAAIYEKLAARADSQLDAEIALGRIWRTQGQNEKAAAYFTRAAALAPARPAVRFYGAANAEQREPRFLRAGVDLRDEANRGMREPRAAFDGATAPELVEWAGLYANAGDFGRAVKCLQAARLVDADYYPAWAQLAEFLAIDGQFDAALREFAEQKRRLPTNRQVLLGEARALAWSRRYDQALDAYARLAALNPADPVPRREAARTAGWGKQRDRGAELYATAWLKAPVDRQLAAALRPLLTDARANSGAARWLEWCATAPDGAEPFAWTERFARERFSLREELPAEQRARLDALYIELLPALRLQRAWWLENTAKQAAWDKRFASAEATYQRLLVAEPGNEEALFDLSQAQAAQGLGEREHATLQRLLAIDANHSLANHAVQRREIRSRPIASLEARYWRERGRGELASMRRLSLGGEVQDTVNDQINVQLAAQIGREMPLTRNGRYAYRGVGLGVDGVFTSWLSGSANFQHREFYDGRIGHADSGQGQLWLKRNSLGVGVGLERREESGNEFALFQGTRSDNFWLGGTAAVTRKFDVDARLTSTRYSDDNQGRSLVIRPAIAWTDHPRIFKTILTLEYRDTDKQSIYFRDPSGRLVGLTHPYWTPDNYTHAALTFEWYRDLAREFFVGSEERFYDLRMSIGLDSESNPAITLEGDWHYEWVDRWVAHAGAYVNLSREWNALGLRLRLARRF